MTTPTGRPEGQEPDSGFTLVELLVVMVVVAVLAAIAVPMLHGVRGRAYIASVKSDVSAITKALTTLQVDGTQVVEIEGAGGEWRLLDGTDELASGKLSEHNVVSANSHVLANGEYCVSVVNEKVEAQFWTTDDTGLRTGDCAPPGP